MSCKERADLVAQVNDLDITIDRLKCDQEALIKRVFPAGIGVFWERANRVQSGIVLDNTGRRIRVENTSTGRRYWIRAFEAVRGEALE